MKDRSSDSCDDQCCAAVETDNRGGVSGLIDVTLPPSHPPSTLLTLLLSCGGLNDSCNDVMERGEGGPGLIDHYDEISSPPPSPSSSMQLSYCGHNDLCGDMAEHGNYVITRPSPYSGAANIYKLQR